MILTTIFNHNFPLTFLYTTLVFWIGVTFSWRQFKGNTNRGIGLWGTFVLACLFGLISIQSGDFFYYGYMIQQNRGIYHFEDFYKWLLKMTNHYLEWRAIVWGSASVLYFLMLKQLPVNKKFACFIFIISQLFYWGTMRNMLGFTMLFAGVSLLFYPSRNFGTIVSYGVGIIMIFSCQFFHRSMYLYTIVMAAAFIPWGKFTVRLSLIAFPFLYTSVFILAKYFLSNFGEDDFQELGTQYIVMGKITSTLLQDINNFIRTTCYAYIIYLCFKYISKNSVPVFFKIMLRYSYILLYVSLLFLGQEKAGWMYTRFLDASSLGVGIPAMYILYRLPRTRPIQISLFGLLWIGIYNWMYMIYTAPYIIAKMMRIEL